MDRAADQLAAVGHQHDLVLVLDREGGDDITVALGARDIGDALPAPVGDAVFIGRGALAIAIGRDGEDELLIGPELVQARRCFPDLAIGLALFLARGAALGAGIAQIGLALGGIGIHVVQDAEGDDLVALGQPDTPDAGGIPAAEDPDIADREADAASAAKRQQHVVGVGAGGDPDEAIALLELHGDLAIGHDIDEIGELVAPDIAARRGEHDVGRLPARLVGRQGQDR